MQHPDFSEMCPLRVIDSPINVELPRVDRKRVFVSDVIQEALCNREGRLSFFNKAHNAVHASKLPNLICRQISVPSDINCEFLANNLSG